MPRKYKAKNSLSRIAANVLGLGAIAFAAGAAQDAVAASLAPAVYYIDNSHPAASDKNAGTSPGAPWATLAPASAKALAPGDMISLKAGTSYDGALSIKSKGTAGAPITVNSYGYGAKPLIRGNPTVGSYASAITLDKAQYVSIDGLALSSAAYSGVNISASNNIVIQNNEIFNVGMGVNVGGQNNLITNNYFHDLKMVKNGGADSYGAVGVTLLAPNNEISYNTCQRCIAPDTVNGYNGGMVELYGPVDNSYIHHNFAQDSDGFIEGGVGTANNVRIVYNVSYNNNGSFACFHFSGNYAYTGTTSILVANNTVVQNKTPAKSGGNLNYFESPPTANSLVFVNNIFALDYVGAIYYSETTRRSNIYQMKAAGSHLLRNWSNALGVGEMVADPGFVDAASANLRPSINSPARGKAVLLDAVGASDLARVPLPASARDIGAYQYQP